MKRTFPTLCTLLLLVLIMGLSKQPARAATSQTLTIDATSPISQIRYPFWGVNYVGFWDAIQGSAASRQALKNAGIQVIRFPGGEPANWHDWSKPDDEPYWTTTSTSDLWNYAQGPGARLLLQTNPTRNEISDTGETNDPSGAHAAGWVRYTMQHKIDAPYWEIGNEPDLGLQGDFNWGAMQWYFDAFNDQAAAMKAANPDIKVFGPAGTNAWQWWGLHSLDMFLAKTGNKQGSGLADGVSLHYYAASGCAGWESVRAVAQDWPGYMEQIKKVIAAYDTRPLPVFITETNAAVGGQNCEINQTIASALSNADLFGAYRASGVQAVQFFGAIHNANSWGMLYGAGDARPADSPTPSYFIFPIWSRSGNEVLNVTGATDAANTLSAYASRRSDGSIQVVVINKSNAAAPLNIAFKGFDPRKGTVRIYELKPASGGVWDKDVLYNGVRMPDVSAASLPLPATASVSEAAFSRSVPAYSLTLFDFSPGTAPTTPVPPGDEVLYVPIVRR